MARGVREKLIHRHPHVFGGSEGDDPGDLVANWEQIKKAEKGRGSVFDGIPATLPALLLALKTHKKAASVGVAVCGDIHRAGLDLTAAALAAETDPTDTTVGDLLMAAVALARAVEVDPEAALRTAASRLAERGRALEAEATNFSDEPNQE